MIIRYFSKSKLQLFIILFYNKTTKSPVQSIRELMSESPFKPPHDEKQTET